MTSHTNLSSDHDARMDSIPSTVGAFKHDVLPDATSHMRLLEIMDANYSDTINVSCKMTTWPTNSIGLPSFHAISYTWGDPKCVTTILINGKPSQVRMNCEFVLKQAHWHGKSRYYWIDALCIDQENLDEKGKQVAIMGNIYKRAAHVLACVGEHTDESRFFFRKLGQFLRTIREFPPSAKSLILRMYFRHGPDTTLAFLYAAINLAKRPYFSRLWVLQELKNAKQVSLLCGSDAVPKDDFEIILKRLHFFIKSLPENPSRKFVRFLWRRDAIFKHCPSQTYGQDDYKDTMDVIHGVLRLLRNDINPVDLVHATIDLQCEIRRDKVYGIISLLDLVDDAPIIPDYTKPDFEVALEFLRAICKAEFVQKRNYDLDLSKLCVCVMHNFGLDSKKTDGIPEALKARNGSQDAALQGGPNLWLKGPLPLARSRAIGWRILADDLTSHDGYVSWSLPRHRELTFDLPLWAEAGDWVLRWERKGWITFYLLLREVADCLWMPILGHCLPPAAFEPRKQMGTATAFEIHWNPEDALIFSMTGIQIHCYYFWLETNNWKKFLNTGICRRQTPWSSYGIKILQ